MSTQPPHVGNQGLIRITGNGAHEIQQLSTTTPRLGDERHDYRRITYYERLEHAKNKQFMLQRSDF